MSEINSTSPCYTFEGRAADRVYTPCNPTVPYSMCCRNFAEGSEPNADSCLPNGLCSNFNGLADLDQQDFWIEFCSDPTWSDPACAKFAPYMQIGGCYQDGTGSVLLGFCQETSTYCCQHSSQNTSCCDPTNSENMMVNISVASMVPVTTSFFGGRYTTALPTLLASTTASAPISGSSSSSSTLQNSERLSVGAGIGIGIVATLVVVFLALGLGCIIRRRSRNKRAVSHHEMDTGAEAKEPRWANKPEMNSPPEMEGTTRYELQP